MLVLCRRVAESVQLDVPPSAEPTVVRLSVVQAAGTVRLGFDAPDQVKILRSELADRNVCPTVRDPSASLSPPRHSAALTLTRSAKLLERTADNACAAREAEILRAGACYLRALAGDCL